MLEAIFLPRKIGWQGLPRDGINPHLQMEIHVVMKQIGTIRSGKTAKLAHHGAALQVTKPPMKGLKSQIISIHDALKG